MSYFTVKYLFFFLPAVILVYGIMPKKIKPLVLLVASYLFFFWISKKLIFFLILSSLSIYFSSLGMRRIDRITKEKVEGMEKEEKKRIKQKGKKKKQILLLLTILFNFSFLFYFKYLNFFASIGNALFDIFHADFSIRLVKHLAPIGISFYTLQAISYVVDVYHEKIEAESNLFKMLLYLSFFPTIMEGPIASYPEVKDSLYEGTRLSYHNLCFGLQRIIFGLFKKCIIADRLNIFVKLTFDHILQYSGITLAFGAIFYTILLYMEFSGTMDVVIGSAEIFGIKLPENFRQPFFSKNISEFWSRWHITLGNWLKNYVFYPVSFSQPVKKISSFFKKKFNHRVSALVMGAIALFAVWSLNGLWHGAGWQFVFFGYYHFTLLMLGNIFEPWISLGCEKFSIHRKANWYHALQIGKTCLLVFIGELFFRANTLSDGFLMLQRIFTHFDLQQFQTEFFHLGLDGKDYLILLIALGVVFLISFLKERGVSIREKISLKTISLRWIIYYALIMSVILFGAYGPGYEPVEPIYADF